MTDKEKNVKLHKGRELPRGWFGTPISVHEVSRSVPLSTLLDKMLVREGVTYIISQLILQLNSVGRERQCRAFLI